MNADWQTISREMRKASPVFIGGVPRSGTTALRTTLDQHPSFRAREQLSAETRVFVEPDALRDALGKDGDRFRTYLLDDAAVLERMVETARSIASPGAGRRLLCAVLRPLGEAPFRRALDWRLCRRADLVRVFFHYAQQARGCKRLLEKTPRHMNFLPEIRATFPRMQALWCVRHPVDVYCSYRKKLLRTEERVGVQSRHDWLRVSPEKFRQLYARWVVRLARVRARDRGQCRVVRYEDLTADPAGTLRDLCAFLGEPFAQESLIGDREVVRDDTGSPRPQSRIVANEKDWRRHLSAEDAAVVEDGLDGVMGSFGYTRRT